MGFDVGNSRFLSLFMHLIPQFFRNNRLMNTVIQHILILLHNMVLISCTWNLLILSSAKCQFATIHRVIQYTFSKGCGKAFNGIVLAKLFLVSAVVKECGNSGNTHGCVVILIVNNSYYLSFILCNMQLTINKLISIRSKTTIPLTFSCLLSATFHGLHQYIFTLYFSHCG